MSKKKDIKEEEILKEEQGEKVEEGNEVKEEVKEEKKEESKEESKDEKYMRLYADYLNLKKRSENERYDARRSGKEDVILELLPILDNFERALNTETGDEKYKEGMSLIFKQLNDALSKIGVKEIEALGKDFDPNFHSAVMMEDSTEYESNKVTCVIQKGYTINDKVIRPAMVKVAN